uniref:Hexokinase C-terminal domain-containing protein n=1 Tax=Meloidogyne floridensis TaxID=298350 RepID=A0A915NPN2_9BILA
LAGFTASLTDCAVLEHISSVICSRSEFLCAAAVAAICQRINKQKIIIGVDSALFCTKRTLQNLESKIECLTEKKILFIIELIDTEEASGRGAAVAAAFEANSPSSEWNYAQFQLNNLRNSEIECKSQNEVLLGQLKAAETKNDQQNKAVKQVRIQPGKNNKHPAINAIKELDLQHSTTILAWHDMLVHMSDRDSEAFNLSKIPEPIL